MYIHEIFSSLQGEGINTGVPTTFIRFQGCNLNCSWCDTTKALEITQNPKKNYSIDKILKLIQPYKNKWVSLTGGEPLIQDQTAFLTLLKKLVSKNYLINIQTNATIFNQEIFPYVQLWSISIKPHLLNQQDYLKNLRKYLTQCNKSNSEFKLVIEKPDSLIPLLDNILSLFPKILIKHLPFILTPDGRKPEKILKNLQLMYNAYINTPNKKIKTLNLYFLPQLHKLLGIA